MNFKQVEAFRAVMATRSMTTAAALLHTSQPNVSRWISLLEKNVGFTLFRRVGTRLVPTPEADIFYLDVERAFLSIDALNETATTIRRKGTGILRIGAVGSITQCVLPNAIRIFRDAHDDVPVVVNTGRSDVVAKWVATGFCDVGFASFEVDLPGVKFEKINTAFGVGIVNKDHRLASLKHLVPNDYADEKFISLPTGSFNREAIDRHFTGIARILSIETPYATTICSMVGQNLGVSIVNPVVSRALNHKDVFETAFSEDVEFHSYSVTSDQNPTSLMATAMIKSVRHAFATLNQGITLHV